MSDTFEWVRIERRFDAPIETIWDLWTQGDQFERWYGPNGMTTRVREMNAAVGGKRHFSMSMQTPERSMTMWFVGAFKEVNAPHRLVYTESMSDEDGNPVSPQSMGMPEGHPEVTEVIVELIEKDGQTHMVMTHVGVPAQSGGAGGWAQAIDKMEALVG